MLLNLLCICLCLCMSVRTEDAQRVCSSPTSTQVSLQAFRSEQGNWLTQVDAEHRKSARFPNMEPWIVNVSADATNCEDQSTLHVRLTLAEPQPKLSGYELFPGLGHYKFHTDVTNWADARQRCAEEGAHLAIINSEAEAEVVKKLFLKHPSIPGADHKEFAWIGLELKYGEPFTIFGDELKKTGFTRNRNGVDIKNIAKSGHCFLVDTTGGLTYHACTWKVAFICEHEL